MHLGNITDLWDGNAVRTEERPVVQKVLLNREATFIHMDRDEIVVVGLTTVARQVGRHHAEIATPGQPLGTRDIYGYEMLSAAPIL